MNDSELYEILTDFVQGLLLRAKCTHSGNCYMMCRILKPYLEGLFGIGVLMENAKVKQGRKKVNHYYLVRVSDGLIIDGTASQFKYPDGKTMPQVYIGIKPEFYINP